MTRSKILSVLAALAALGAAGCDNDSGGVPAGGVGNTTDTGTITDKDTSAGDTSAGDTSAGDTSAGDTSAGDTSAGDTSAGDTGPSGAFNYFQTCGDPVCSGWKSKPNVPLCKAENVGDACATKGGTCDPKNGCNALLLCNDKDPKAGPGGCPISRRNTKREIDYLDSSAERRFAEQLYGMKLATWRYKGGDGSRKLGIIIDDAPGSIAIDGRGDRIDLYSYTSLAIAAAKQQQRTLQQQQALLHEQGTALRQLRGEVATLKARLKGYGSRAVSGASSNSAATRSTSGPIGASLLGTPAVERPALVPSNPGAPKNGTSRQL
jgi:hypothetical protein